MSAPTMTHTHAQSEPPASPALPRPRQAKSAAFFAFAATAFAVLAASSSLQGVISDWGWMLQVGIVVIVVLLVINTARYFALPRFLSPLLGLFGGIAAVTVLFFANTAFLGFFPTSATYQAVLQVVELANAQMGSQVPPVQSSGVIIFSVAIWAMVVALAADTLAFTLRAPVFAGIPLAILPAISSLFEPRGAGIGSVALTCIGFLLILAAARHLEVAHPKLPGYPLRVQPTETRTKTSSLLPAKPGNSVVQGIVVLAGGLIVILLLPSIVPGFNKGMLVEGTRPSWGNVATNIDPMIALGNDLRSNSAGQILHYYTDAKSPLYLRTSVIGNMDGRSWKPDESLLRVPTSENLPVPMLPTMVSENQQVITRVTTDKYRGAWLPVPGNLVSLEGLPSNWQWIPDTNTIINENTSQSTGQDFMALSQEPKITAQVLRQATDQLGEGYFDSVNPEYSQLPEDVPGNIQAAIDRATAGIEDATPYERAVAIQDYLRSNTFNYSEKTPVEDGYDGSGMDVIKAFLDKKSGYCIHFASTMALMARTLEIPSRIVTGYSPGSATGESVTSSNGTRLQEFTVTSRNAHAWPELYFAGVGWVAFEPTPGRGIPPAYAPAQAAPTPTQGEDPRISNPTTRRSEQSAAASSSEQAEASTNQPTADNLFSPWLLLGVPFVVVFLGSIPWTLRRMQRSSRLTALEAPPSNTMHTGAAAAWAELVAMGIDYSLPMRQDESAGDYARRLCRRFPAASNDLRMLTVHYERQRYSRTPDSGSASGRLVEALHGVERAMKETISPTARFGIRVWPRSIFAPKPLAETDYAESK